MNEQDNLLWQKINSETASIRFVELARFFARGVMLVVDLEMDLVDVAFRISKDETRQVTDWQARSLLRFATDDEALRWNKSDTLLWAVVVAPWVLVQEKKIDTPSSSRKSPG